MKNKIKIVLDTPWKFIDEILMIITNPFVLLFLRAKGVKIGKGAKFYGFPRFLKHKNSKIMIGNNFECRSWRFSNPLGLNHPTIICTWGKGAVVEIGDDVGISGGSIVATRKIIIGNGVLIGANSTIIDTNFHPTGGKNIRYSQIGVKSAKVIIGNNVFIGMSTIVLKGARIKNNSIIAAGGVIKK